MDAIYVAIICLLTVIATTSVFMALKWRAPRHIAQVNIYSSLEKIKEIGELSVLSAYIKEVVDQKINEDSRFKSTGKVLLICSYDVEFKYDLSKVRVALDQSTGRSILFMPPHFMKVSTNEAKFYHEEKSALLGMGIFSSDIELDARNHMLKEAKNKAVELAGVLNKELEQKIRASAESTLTKLAGAFGKSNIDFQFEDSSAVVQSLPTGEERKAA